MSKNKSNFNSVVFKMLQNIKIHINENIIQLFIFSFLEDTQNMDSNVTRNNV